jgi:hypothetical protein
MINQRGQLNLHDSLSKDEFDAESSWLHIQKLLKDAGLT